MFATNRPSLTARLAPVAMLVALAALASARADEPADPPGRVARVSVALGTVSMQPAGSESWVSDVLNRPLTNGDKLWADRESRAELHVGSTAVRLGSETGVGILNIDDRTVQLRLSAGTLQVRVRALGTEQTFEIATPTASVAVLRPGEYRIEVGDGTTPLRIAVAQGQVAVTDQGHQATVEAGQLAEYDGGSIEEARISALPPGDAFDQWVADRDRREERAVATRYVSREVIGYEDLDDYGSWRTVDEYGPVWVPAVSVGWAPYRYGHWGWIAPWGWTWIDEAPWGFAPFHYGRWVFVGSRWCWAPGPRRYAPVYAPALVGWVGGAHWSVGVSVGGGGPPVGWFPLGWNEVYMPAYRVSNNYVRNVNVTNIHVTNTTINTYITNNTTIINGAGGRKTTGDGNLAGQRYANLAVAGAVTATTRTAFTSAQPIAAHLAKISREAIEPAAAGTAAPPIAPTARSLGRPAAVTPRAAAEIWSRPVVARTAPPPPPPTFEAQRQAVLANGGRPVPGRAIPAPRADRAGVAAPAVSPRSDVIHVAPQPPAAGAGSPAAAAPPSPAPRHGRPERSPAEGRAAPPAQPVQATPPPAAQGAPRARDDRPPMQYPAGPGARPVERGQPATPPAPPVAPTPPPPAPSTPRSRDDRPPMQYPAGPGARPVERAQPATPPARPVTPTPPPPAPSTPRSRDDRPPMQYPAGPDARSVERGQPATPAARPVTPPPAPPAQVTPRARDDRPPMQYPAAPDVRPVQRSQPAAPQPAPQARPVQPPAAYRPPAEAPREARAPPPPPHEAHPPPAAHPDKPSKPEPRDNR